MIKKKTIFLESTWSIEPTWLNQQATTRSHADVWPWVICWIICFYNFKFGTLTALCAFCENETSVSLWFWGTQGRLSSVFSYSSRPTSVSLKSIEFFHLLTHCSWSHMILPNSFVKLAWSWLWKLFRHTKPQNELFSNAASRFLSLTWRDWGF